MGQVLEPGFYLYLELVYLKANKLENSQLLRRCAFHRIPYFDVQYMANGPKL